ncbi:MAG TPA: response regulator transcription factor [Stellaceae bacterium]|nr:response regulator transcription factor [Stellaceae bacterium]
MRLLVIDDHPVVRSGLRRLLSGENGIEVHEAASGKDALVAFRDQPPDLVVLDLRLPGMSGLELIKRLKLENPALPILVLSIHQESTYVARALQAGANGFVSKNIVPEELKEAIRQVAKEKVYIERGIAQELVMSNIAKLTVPMQGLSPREFEILRLLGEGSSLREIAETVGVSYKSAANVCAHLKAKLNARNTADLVRIAVQTGARDPKVL